MMQRTHPNRKNDLQVKMARAEFSKTTRNAGLATSQYARKSESCLMADLWCLLTNASFVKQCPANAANPGSN